MSEQDDIEIRCLGCGEIQGLDEDACPNCDIDEEAYVAACRGAPSTIQPGAVKAMASVLDGFLEVERVTEEVLADLDHYDSLIEALASDTAIKMLLYCIASGRINTGMNQEVQASMWREAEKLAHAEIERRRRLDEEARAEP